MRGRARFKQNILLPDKKYKSFEVTRFINKLMNDGEKTVAASILYSAIEIASSKKSVAPLDLFEQALKNVSPQIEVKSKRIGGATYQVPIEVRPHRKSTLAMRWIITAAKARSGKSMAESLATQLIEAYDNSGTAVKKRDEVHRMAEANKAFAHYARI